MERTSSYTILLVQDSPTERLVIQHWLETEGYRVSSTGDPLQAVPLALSCRPDLIVCDVIMPSMDGYELCRRFKSHPSLKHIPVLLRTALLEPEDVICGLDSGADNFLVNSTDPSDLLCRIRDILLTHRLRGEKKMDSGLQFCFRGKTYRITSPRQQILDLLISSTEATLAQNRALKQREQKLMALNGALEQARAQAQLVVRSAQDLLCNLIHKIRAPLNGVMGMLELALEQGREEQRTEYLAAARESAEQLLSLINETLDYSWLDDRCVELQQVAFCLRDVVKQTLQVVWLSARCKGLELTSHVDPQVPDLLCGDPARLKQILLNLLDNAIKFTREGAVVLCVRQLKNSQSEVELEFSISDTGPGIPPDQREHIFQAFTRLEGKPSLSESGAGLGLAICNQLVTLMGGRIWAESPARLPVAAPPDRLLQARSNGEGPGSSFFFTVQFKLKNQSRPALNQNTAVLAGKTVLVVEGQPINRMVFRHMLSRVGMQVTTVTSGGQALALLERGERYAAYVVDEHLPDWKGPALGAKIQQLHTGARIVLLASLGRSGNTRRCQEVGTQAYLSKPVFSWELYAVLAALLGNQNQETTTELVTRPRLPKHSRPLRILVAEDNPVNQKLAHRLLEKMGHQVTIAANGKEAVHLYQTKPFDVVFMDMQMPEMNGVEAARAIRNLDTGGRCPIFALTADTNPQPRKACLDAGMDGVLAKPLRTAEIQSVLQAIGFGDKESTATEPALVSSPE